MPSRATILNTSATISQHAEIGHAELAKINSKSMSRTTRQLIANAMAQLDFIRRTADKLNEASDRKPVIQCECGETYAFAGQVNSQYTCPKCGRQNRP